MRTSWAVAGVLLACTPVPVLSCTVLSRNAVARVQDVEVIGGLKVTGDRTAILRTEKVIQGLSRNWYMINWEPPLAEDSGAGCPTWFPLHDRQHGTFHLTRQPDGRYMVLAAETDDLR